MTRTTHILAAVAVAAAAAAARADGPVTFARSGRPAQVAVAGDVAEDVVLTAFGRKWTEPAPAGRGEARISVPNVRTATAFDVVTAPGARKVGELVAYPARDVTWDQAAAIAAAGGPKWFRQWAEAIGLPVQWLGADELRKWPSNRPGKKGRALLVLGRRAAGATPARLLRAGKDAPPNVLVLDARWFGPWRRARRPVSATPARMTGPLSELRGQDWPKPPTFAAPAAPYPGICNRRAWIEGDPDPLVEEIARGASGRRVVLSYVRWQEQLGRNESADRLLLAVLRAAAVPAGASADAKLVHPVAGKVDADTRPILAAATATGGQIPRRRRSPVLVLDLRGDDSPPPATAQRLDALQRIVHAGSPLLILGDDPLLDRCKWLRIDRRKRRTAAAHVTWLADDALPATGNARITLMRTLTNLDVLLWKPERESTDEDQTDH